jgi:hypothetical protein
LTVRGRWAEQVAWHVLALVGDLHAFCGRLQQLGVRVEAASVFGESGAEERGGVLRTVNRGQCYRVVGRRSQVSRTGAYLVARFGTFLGDGRQALPGSDPFPAPTVGVSVGNAICRSEHLSNVACAVVHTAQRALEFEIELIVVKELPRHFSLP